MVEYPESRQIGLSQLIGVKDKHSSEKTPLPVHNYAVSHKQITQFKVSPYE